MRCAVLALATLLAIAPARADGVRFEVWPPQAHVWRVTDQGDLDLGPAASVEVLPEPHAHWELAVKAPGYAPQYWNPSELQPVERVVLLPQSASAYLSWWLHFHPWLTIAALGAFMTPLGLNAWRRAHHAQKVRALRAAKKPEDPWQGRQVGPYVLGKKLGIGSRAVVHEALPVEPGPRVALKILRADQNLRRFQREIRICRLLVHRHIVRLLDSGENDGVSWLALELVSGQTLADMIKNGPLDVATFRTIFPQVLDAVAYAHRRGVIHRDLKPDNILVDGSQRAKVLDFGVAQLAEGTRLTHAGALVGTLVYMAPEQLREETSSPASDQFALGVMGRELLTGDIPFLELGSDALYANRIMGTAPPPMEGVPVALAAVIERMMAPQPADRFPSVEAALRAIARA